ncbi:hypothetical protein E2C01_041285 [Portunus trituberculatus]|uniref:Uncharacterized protein n=1 Tax=Portunus trituberculatus TaxID=210409 RepID=A0A5B7FQB1_PORTR|nr:hypothetical protein [Portunus trituberculatus]
MYPSGGADVGRVERDLRSAVSLGRGLGLLLMPSFPSLVNTLTPWSRGFCGRRGGSCGSRSGRGSRLSRSRSGRGRRLSHSRSLNRLNRFRDFCLRWIWFRVILLALPHGPVGGEKDVQSTESQCHHVRQQVAPAKLPVCALHPHSQDQHQDEALPRHASQSLASPCVHVRSPPSLPRHGNPHVVELFQRGVREVAITHHGDRIQKCFALAL